MKDLADLVVSIVLMVLGVTLTPLGAYLLVKSKRERQMRAFAQSIRGGLFYVIGLIFLIAGIVMLVAGIVLMIVHFVV